MNLFSEDKIITKQLNELYDSNIFKKDKEKYLGKEMTEEILLDYSECNSWLRANIFINENRIINKIGIGFIGTGGGANIFDYLFRDKSSRTMIFANMPYHPESTYRDYKEEFNEKKIFLLDNNFYKSFDSINKHQISACSEDIAEVLSYASFNKLEKILENQQDIFMNFISFSLTVDFGSENDKPARFFACYTQKNKTKIFGFLFSEKDSREKMNFIIVINLLNILSNEINNPSYDYYEKVNIEDYPKRSSELVKEENKKYYNKLYLLSNYYYTDQKKE
jgi:hypothetical protein